MQQSDHRGECFAFTLKNRQSPGGPILRTPSFHCKGHRFHPWSGDSTHGVLHGHKRQTKQNLESILVFGKLSLKRDSGISLDGIWAVLKSGRWRQKTNGIEVRLGFSPGHFPPDQAASLIL